MKKLISLVVLGVLFVSCTERELTEPIEKYQNKGIILIEEQSYTNLGRDAILRVKTKDSIFNIKVTTFDAKNLKVGDTIK